MSLTLFVAGLVLGGAGAVQAQSGRDAAMVEAGQLLSAGRGNEARIRLQNASRDGQTADARFGYRLAVADAYLYDGDYTRAARIYQALLERDSAGAVSDSLMRRLYHGMALVDAFDGRPTQAATNFGRSLAMPLVPLPDSIEMLIVTGQHAMATGALDRIGTGATTRDEKQFVASYRAFNLMAAGHCGEALKALDAAPDRAQPMPLAVQGRCAAKHGDRTTARALRDSVLQLRTDDPFAWPVIIARDVARKIQ